MNAIYAAEDVPMDLQALLEINETLSKSWPVITKGKGSLPDAEHWKNSSNKLLDVAL